MPEAASLATLQAGFTRHVRNPAQVPLPPGVEQRRMKIYNDLVYNNIEGFLSGSFPVLHKLYRDEDWHRLVRRFVTDYRCDSPYFLDISQQFLNYLMHDYQPTPTDPDFLLELAHYEWVELALDVATDVIPEPTAEQEADLLRGVPVLSPLVWSLSYRYPVHLIGPGFEPEQEPAERSYLIVFRDRCEQVQFMESNAATARLLALLRDNESGACGAELLERLAREMNADSVTSIVEFGARMLEQFHRQHIIAFCKAV